MKVKFVNSILRKKLLLLPVILSIIAVTACTSKEASAPSLKILIPRDSPTARGISGAGNCPVLVEVTNFQLVDKPGKPNVAGEGHIHYFLDVDPPTDPGKAAVTAAGTYAATTDTVYWWPDIGKGPHTFWVQLVNNDHTPLNPPVITKSSVTAGLWDG